MLDIQLLAAALGVALVVACNTSDLLTVTTPNSVGASLYDDPINSTLMVNGAIGDFECAFGGFVMGEGIASDELADASINNSNWPLDRRDEGFTPGTYGTSGCFTTSSSSGMSGIYTPLSTARSEADAAITRLGKWTDAQVPTRTALLAQANLYAGFSYATLGMSMCQAAFDQGPLVGQLGMFALAENRFTAAIAAAQAGGATSILYAAYVGRARERLFQHNPAGAIADANLVPKGFVFNAGMDATDARRYNHVFQSISTGGLATVESSARALTTENGEIDPRSTTIQLNTVAANTQTVIYIPTKYNAASLAAGEAIPMPIARYEEAQLILAEVQGGASAVAIVNALRAAVALAPYTGPTDATSITNLIASERQRALFVEGFRAFDVERLNLPLVPAVGSPYYQGGVYGATVCLPLPDIERINNPNIGASKIISGVRGQFTTP